MDFKVIGEVTVRVTVQIPALEQLLPHLAAFMDSAATPAPASATPAATPAPVSSSPAAPVMPEPASPPQAAPVMSAPTAPATSPAMPAPVAPAAAPTAAPAYTTEQIAKAGAELAQAGKMPQLMALLQQYGVQAVTQLRPDQYGEFATALRGLGAQL